MFRLYVHSRGDTFGSRGLNNPWNFFDARPIRAAVGGLPRLGRS